MNKDYFDDWEDKRFYSWLAGFWEGDGCFINYYPPSAGRSLRNIPRVFVESKFQISQKTPDILYSIKKRTNLGEVYKCNQPFPFYQWTIGSKKDIITLLNNLLPLLSFRKEMVEEGYKKIIQHSPRLFGKFKEA